MLLCYIIIAATRSIFVSLDGELWNFGCMQGVWLDPILSPQVKFCG